MLNQQTVHKARNLLLSASLLFFFFLWGGTSFASDRQPMFSFQVKRETVSPIFKNLALKDVYSELIRMDVWQIREKAKAPEVIFEFLSDFVEYGPTNIAIQLDFAYFPGCFPQIKSPKGSVCFWDEGPFLGDRPNWSGEIRDFKGGFMGLSLLLYGSSSGGKFIPYLWLRGMRKPPLCGPTSGVDVNYATSVQAGIPFQLSSRCSFCLEGGFILARDENTGKTKQINGMRLSLRWTF